MWEGEKEKKKETMDDPRKWRAPPAAWHSVLQPFPWSNPVQEGGGGGESLRISLVSSSFHLETAPHILSTLARSRHHGCPHSSFAKWTSVRLTWLYFRSSDVSLFSLVLWLARNANIFNNHITSVFFIKFHDQSLRGQDTYLSNQFVRTSYCFVKPRQALIAFEVVAITT